MLYNEAALQVFPLVNNLIKRLEWESSLIIRDQLNGIIFSR
jgi:hypothetical protein